MQYQYRKDLVDNLTGELLESTSAVITKSKLNKKSFVKTFVDDLSLLCKCTRAESSVIWSCLQFIDYRSNEILLTSNRRKEISENSDLSINTVNQSVCKLKKKNILVSDNGKLFFHPNLFISCNEETASKVYELTLRYELNDGKENE
jgi:hypothetical protein